ncbi:hypothetical protein MMC25_005985 [Agyrium rufum]|nr:hypothetical protein [Agyrium rufum]
MSSAESPSEDAAQRQARIRREKREAKIKATGNDRLAKITGLSGRPVEPAPLPPSQQAATNTSPTAHRSPTISDDPEEVDITHHPYTTSRSSSQQQPQNIPNLQDLLRFQGGPPPNGSQPGFGGGNGGPPGDEDDPIMRMMQQMLGGLGGGGGMNPDGTPADGQTPQLPPALAAMLGATGPGAGASSESLPQNTSGNLWRIVHFLAAFSLSLYILLSPSHSSSSSGSGGSSFTGTHLSRTAPPPSDETSMTNIISTPFFWIFATVELLLQSTRFMLEKGRPAQGGMVGMAANFLPEPWRGRLLLVSRYAGIWSTVVEDGMVVVFVLGCVAWWQGEVG